MFADREALRGLFVRGDSMTEEQLYSLLDVLVEQRIDFEVQWISKHEPSHDDASKWVTVTDWAIHLAYPRKGNTKTLSSLVAPLLQERLLRELKIELTHRSLMFI